MGKRHNLKKRALAALCAAILLLGSLFSGCAGVVDFLFETGKDFESMVSAYQESGADSYYFDRLSETEKQIYVSLLEEVADFPERVQVPDTDTDHMIAAYSALLYDHPELFYLNLKFLHQTIGDRVYMKLMYLWEPDEIPAKIAEVEQAGREILSGVQTLEPYQQELAFHDWIGQNVEYDYEAVETIATDPTGYNLYDVLIGKKAICEGIAKTMKYLMDSAGIENYLIYGQADYETGETFDHMWNIIVLDGAEYHVDATWDISLRGDVSHLYFNLTDAEISADHRGFPENGRTATKYNYFEKTKAKFPYRYDAYKTMLIDELIAGFESDTWDVELRFQNDEAFRNGIQTLLEEEEIFYLIRFASDKVGGQEVSEVQYMQNESLQYIRFFAGEDAALQAA